MYIYTHTLADTHVHVCVCVCLYIHTHTPKMYIPISTLVIWTVDTDYVGDFLYFHLVMDSAEEFLISGEGSVWPVESIRKQWVKSIWVTAVVYSR